MNVSVNQINYGFIKEDNFRTNLCKNDLIMYSTDNEDTLVVC